MWLTILGLLLAPSLHAATPPEESLGPEPVLRPEIPAAGTAFIDPDESLLKRLMQRQRSIDARIGQLIRQYDDVDTVVTIRRRPELDEARRQRDEAWINIRAALVEEHRGIIAREADPLERAPSETGDAFVRELEAQHHLTLAMTYKDLYESDGGNESEHLRRGLALLEGIAEERLPLALQPQRRFHIIWFLVEQARMLPAGAERIALEARIRRLVTDFAVDFPDNELTGNAQWLLRMLDLGNEVDASRRRIQEEGGPALAPDGVEGEP